MMKRFIRKEKKINELKSRYTPINYNWHFCVTHNELTNIITTVIIILLKLIFIKEQPLFQIQICLI